MDQLRKAAQQALKWFDWLHAPFCTDAPAMDSADVRQALRAALAEPAEPVAWYGYDTKGKIHFFDNPGELGLRHPLYTAPQPAKREPLTDEEIAAHFREDIDTGSLLSFADGVRFAERVYGITKEVS